MASQALVTTSEALQGAVRDAARRVIAIGGTLSGLPSIRLLPGQSLVGGAAGATLAFAAGSDGLQLSTDNDIRDLRIEASPDRRAIFNDTGVEGSAVFACRRCPSSGRSRSWSGTRSARAMSRSTGWTSPRPMRGRGPTGRRATAST